MRLFLVPCNAMRNAGFVAEDRGLIVAHEYLSGAELPGRMGG